MAIKAKNKASEKRSTAKGKVAEDPEPQDDEVDEENEVESTADTEQNESEEDKLVREEQEVTATRKKELKSMSVDQVKALVSSKGLEAGKKEEMIDAVLHRETAERAEARLHQVRIREAVLEKKGELEGMGIQELKKACMRIGIMDADLKKPSRVEVLMKKWQEDDGIDKALARGARNRREEKLNAMDEDDLRTFCESAGLDPFVKEVLVERIVQRERDLGRFLKPSCNKADETSSTKSAVDVVDSLVASEAARKQEKERERQQKEANEKRLTDLRALNVDELKKQLVARNHDGNGKKEELIAALFRFKTREDAISARKTELKGLAPDKLKALLASNGLDLSSINKNSMVDAILAHEAKTEESVRVFEERFAAALTKRKEDLEAKTTAELKDMCSSKNLKPGVGKDAHVERLLEEEKATGELDRLVSVFHRQTRHAELSSMEKEDLVSLCASVEASPLVKQVMVERVLAHEQEFGRIEDPSEPKKKKARTSRK